jgi:hypothetical protein
MLFMFILKVVLKKFLNYLKNSKMKRIVIMFTLSMMSLSVCSQSSSANNIPTGLNHLGWDAFTTDPLNIEHKGNQPINWHLNGAHRMQLELDETVNINGFNVAHGGFLGLSSVPNFFTTGKGPYSLLHLHGPNFTDPPQEGGFRPWMNCDDSEAGRSNFL